MSHYKPYPAYKASGVEWLEQVPAEWEISKLGYLSWVRARLGWKGLKAEEYVSEGYALLATPNIKFREIDFENVNFVSKARYDESPEIKIRVGDVLLAKDGSTLGTTNIVKELPVEATVNSSLAVITPGPKLESTFLHFYLRSELVVSTIQLLKGGMGVPHLFQSDLNRFNVPLPPLQEQKTIVSHLEKETARIDALVEKKTCFIELLREKRQAVITQAVSKGFESSVKLKESGVAFLGEVPEHWDVTPLKYVTSHIGSGKTPTGGAEAYQDSGVIFLRSQNVYEDGPRLEDVAFISKEIDEEMKGSRVKENDVLLNITGASIGRSCHVSRDIGAANVNQHVCIIRASVREYGPWIARLMSSHAAQSQIDYFQNGAGREGLNFEQIGNMAFAYPPPAEASKIVEMLNQRVKILDSLVLKSERSIELLKERRSALITAAVTGQIDLREPA